MPNKLSRVVLFLSAFVLGAMPTLAPTYAEAYTKAQLSVKNPNCYSNFCNADFMQSGNITTIAKIKVSTESELLSVLEQYNVEKNDFLESNNLQYVTFDGGVITGPAAGGFLIVVIVVVALVGILILAADSAEDVVRDGRDMVNDLQRAIEEAWISVEELWAAEEITEAENVIDDIIEVEAEIEILEQIIQDHLDIMIEEAGF